MNDTSDSYLVVLYFFNFVLRCKEKVKGHSFWVQLLLLRVKKFMKYCSPFKNVPNLGRWYISYFSYEDSFFINSKDFLSKKVCPPPPSCLVTFYRVFQTEGVKYIVFKQFEPFGIKGACVLVVRGSLLENVNIGTFIPHMKDLWKPMPFCKKIYVLSLGI